MASINSVNVSGNLTSDCELRATNSGKQMVIFSLAINDGYMKDGVWENRPCYIDVVRFGDNLNKLSDLLVKGAHVAVQGKLQFDTWEKDGQKRSKHKIMADKIDVSKSYGVSVNFQEQPQQPQDAYASEEIPF